MDFLNRKARQPSIFKKFLAKGSIEEEAFQAFTHKKKMEEMRYELLTLLQFRYGSKAKSELIALEGKIRKPRQEEVYRKEELKQKIIDFVAVTIVFIMISSFVIWVVWMKYG